MRLPLLLLGLLLCAAACAAGPQALSEPPARPASAAFFSNSVGFVQGWIGEHGPYWFLVDTGASRSALDSGIADALGLARRAGGTVEGTAGTIAAQSVHVPLLTVAGVALRGLEPTVYDLSGSLAPPGEHIAGIIGYDAMRGHAVLFDRTNGRLAFAARAGAFGDLRAAAIVPFVLDNNIPRVEARIDGQPVALRIDTGASIGPGPNIFVNVTESFYERLRAAEPGLAPYAYFTASGTGGEIRMAVVRARSLELGGLVIDAPRLIVQPRAGYFANPDAVGFLGGYALQRSARFVVDYPGRRLILFR